MDREPWLTILPKPFDPKLAVVYLPERGEKYDEVVEAVGDNDIFVPPPCPKEFINPKVLYAGKYGEVVE